MRKSAYNETMMKRWQTGLLILLILSLLISVGGNLMLGWLWQQEVSQSRNLRTNLINLRQENSELQQEISQLHLESELPQLMADMMDTIADETETLRQLDPQRPVTRNLVSKAEMGEILDRILTEAYPLEDQTRDQIIMTTLELIPPDVNLGDLFSSLLSEQVAGLYDPAEETLYVLQLGRRMGGFEKTIFAHEHTHALQDQHFDLQALGMGGAESDYTDDELVAIQALVEGDATLTMQQYSQRHLTAQDMVSLLGTALSIDQEALNSAPPYLRQSMMFPYQQGLIFVTHLYANGGWAAVDQAFAEPPQSSEQILHPHLYPHETPQLVSLPPLTTTLGEDWQLAGENVLGEFTLQNYLDVYLSNNQASQAAKGWGGDRYAIYYSPQNEARVLVIKLVWDSLDEQIEFTTLFESYAAERFGSTVTPYTETNTIWWEGNDVLTLSSDSTSTETIIMVTPNKEIREAVFNRLLE